MHEFTQRRESISYHYGNISTPFQKPNQNSAGYLGVLVRTTKIWRMLSFFCFCINLLLSLWLLTNAYTPWTHVKVAQMLSNGYVERIADLNQVNTYETKK